MECTRLHPSPADVALRKESVDRNVRLLMFFWLCGVALRKESVDRNETLVVLPKQLNRSLSARRAWIEMANFCRNRFCPTVALRKESVDRNVRLLMFFWLCGRSLSARRAWIEIPAGCWRESRRAVALRKESVDRNFTTRTRTPIGCGRSPQGERG